MQVQHILVTRYNIASDAADAAGIDGLDPQWLAHRDLLFRRYCVPSVARQTSRDFRWFVAFHPDTPARFFAGLDGVATVVLEPDFVRAAATIERELSSSGIVIASKLDNDDILAPDYIERVRSAANARLLSGGSGDFLVSAVDGLLWNTATDEMVAFAWEAGPFLSLVELRKNGKAWRSPLGLAHPTANTIYPEIRLRSDQPLWMQIVHDRNIANHLHWKAVLETVSRGPVKLPVRTLKNLVRFLRRKPMR